MVRAERNGRTRGCGWDPRKRVADRTCRRGTQNRLNRVQKEKVRQFCGIIGTECVTNAEEGVGRRRDDTCDANPNQTDDVRVVLD